MAEKKVSTSKTTAKKRPVISAEDIRLRAEKIYQERLAHGKQGDHLSDWLQAEKEMNGNTKVS
jgi:hypothetical protein